MTRSLWKGPFVDACLLRSKSVKAKLWSRRSCILPQFLATVVQIYNGQKFVKSQITEEMIGHKFGEFAATRRRSMRKQASAQKARR